MHMLRLDNRITELQICCIVAKIVQISHASLKLLLLDIILTKDHHTYYYHQVDLYVAEVVGELYIMESDIITVNAIHSPRGLVDS